MVGVVHDAQWPSFRSDDNLRHDWESKGGVTFIFQPAEEGKGGAKRIISEGGLRGAQAVSGLHVWPGASSGVCVRACMRVCVRVCVDARACVECGCMHVRTHARCVFNPIEHAPSWQAE
eukprot:scaffold1432_cov20-Tisochrysis_lutea.AAC.1